MSHGGRRAALTSLLVAVLCFACLRASATRSQGIEVKRGSTTEEKLEIAKSVVTQERYARLVQQLRKRFPSMTESQLATFQLRWGEVHRSGSDEYRVFVTVIIEEQPGVDAAAVVNAAAELLAPEING
jgi:Tfp pilus assembly protein PilE